MMRNSLLVMAFCTVILSCSKGKVKARVPSELTLASPVSSPIALPTTTPTPSPSLSTSPSSSVLVYPQVLTSFTGVTGKSIDGDIDLSWSYPTDFQNAERMRIVRVTGDLYPSSCDVGTEILNIALPSSLVQYTDRTGSILGERFSYRACIYNSHDHTSKVSSVIGAVQARDTEGPSRLVSFTAQTGEHLGEIKIRLQLPFNVATQYSAIVLRRVRGNVAPSPSCNEGDLISLSAPYFNDEVRTYIDPSFSIYNTNESVSYRVCIYDKAIPAQMTSSDVAAGVSPKSLTPSTCSLSLSHTKIERGSVKNIIATLETSSGDYIVRRINNIGLVGAENSLTINLESLSNGKYTVRGEVLAPFPEASASCTTEFEIIDPICRGEYTHGNTSTRRGDPISLAGLMGFSNVDAVHFDAESAKQVCKRLGYSELSDFNSVHNDGRNGFSSPNNNFLQYWNVMTISWERKSATLDNRWLSYLKCKCQIPYTL